MNSTLPNFTAATAAPAAGAALLNSVTLAGLLPGLQAAPMGEGATPAAPPEFAALMPPAAVPTLTAQAMPPALPVVAPPTVVAMAPTIVVAGPVKMGNAVKTATAETTEVPEEIREQAVAFAVSLLQSFLPEATVPAQDGAISDLESPVETTTGGAGEGWISNLGTGMPPAAPTGVIADSAMTETEFETSSDPKPDLPEGMDVADLESAAPSGAMTAIPAASAGLESHISNFKSHGAQPWLAVSPDGSVEFKIALPPQAVADLKSANPKFEELPVDIHAELEVPGQPVVRVEATGFAAAEAPIDASAVHRENFAGKIRSLKRVREAEESVVERNFEFTGDKQVKSRSPQAGIGVAQADSIMPAAPTEEPRAARKPQDTSVLPVRAEFQVAQTPAERITAPAPGPAGQTFAERAVDTVTGLVEAQFSASMQKSGSVHLRLKFGGEDLSVHVAIRDGAVHTDFRTDSAPLRAAIEREWHTVATASPEQMQRYAEPVFGTGSAHSNSNSPFSQGDSRQQTAQQHQAQPDAQQHRAPREGFDGSSAFNRRSLVSESFVPEPPAPRVPALLPTSLRLSALA